MDFINVRLKLKIYKTYKDRVVFKVKCGSNGVAGIPKTLGNLCNFKYIYIKTNDKFSRFDIRKSFDRQFLINRCYIGTSYSGKYFPAYLKLNKKYSQIIGKALKSKVSFFDKYRNQNIKVLVSPEGKLLLRWIVPLSSKNAKTSRIAHFVAGSNGKTENISLGKLKETFNYLRIDPKLLSPFIHNYFVYRAKKEIIFPKGRHQLNPEIYRLIGLINGDGHLNDYGIMIYGNDKEVHNDFCRISKELSKGIQIKKTIILTSNVAKTYYYSNKIARSICEAGGIKGRKLDFAGQIKLPTSYLALKEYFSGTYDTEGTIIKDSNIVLPSSVTLYNSKIKSLTKKDFNYLRSLAIKEARYYKSQDTGSESLAVGLNLLKKNKIRKELLVKIHNYPPGLGISHMHYLAKLGINPKLDLKCINIYPKKNTVTAAWWVKIGRINDVIKFVSIIEPHILRKKEKLENFVLNYINSNDLRDLRSFTNKNGR